MHLTNNQVVAYWRRELSPTDLLSLDGHIGECQGCREMLFAAAPPASFRSPPDPVEHLEYEQIEEYVNGAGSAEGRVAVERHAAACESCRAELEDLRRFQSEYRRRPQPIRRPKARPVRWWLAVAASAAAIGLGVFVIERRGVPESAPDTVTAIVRDGGRQLGLDNRGRMRGLAQLPETENTMLAAILAGGNLPLAGPRPELRVHAASTRSPGDAAAEFTVTDPAGRTVLDDRPAFRWTALPRASWYRVQILDSDYRLVAESPSLAATEWRPDKALPRDRVYSWQVTAIRSGGEIRSPRPPASEARFAVLDEAHAQQLKVALARTPVSHLELAALFAEAGMGRECLQELQSLENENPRSELVARLRAHILRESAR